MNAITYYLFFITQIIKIINVSSVSYNGYCGDPGRPVRSQLSPVQLIYKEGETVAYTCDDYISLKQYRQCIRGSWVGSPAVCGNSLRDNDLRKVKVFNAQNNTLIKEYIITNLSSFDKFGNSFLAERYPQPIRAFGAKKYRFELYLSYKSIFRLLGIGFSVVNHLTDEKIRNTPFNITKLTVSPYRKCFLSQNSSVKPWVYNSTRFDHWFSCESIDDENYDKEMSDFTDSVIIHTESNGTLELDLSGFIVAKPYTAKRNPRETLCGTPEVPLGLDIHEIYYETQYAIRCAQGFRQMDDNGDSHELICGKNMNWLGKLPQCFPKITCDKFLSSNKDSLEVYLYENVYYHNSSLWFAIEGTKAYFRCTDDTQLFIGKEVRNCDKSGVWTESLPKCLNTTVNLSPTAITIIVVIILIITFSLIAISIFCYKNSRKINNTNESDLSDSNIYDEYDMTAVPPKLVDTEIYEDPDQEVYNGKRYQSTNPTPNTYTQIEADYDNDYDNCVEYKYDLNSQDLDNSYVKMTKIHN